MDHKRVAAILERMTSLLRAAKEDRWVEVVSDASSRVLSPWSTTQEAGIDIIRSLFGGMGALQDLVFSEEAHNVPEGYSPEEANAQFQSDLHELYSLTKR